MDFEVRRNDLREHRLVESPVPEPSGGEVVLHLDHAALTANNITYAAFGDVMGYWNFFPADDGWGRVPVWGFADVVSSRVEGIADGDRVYGYFPMSTHLVVTPGRVTPTGFVDAAAHRAALPPVYNQYLRVPPRASGADLHDEHVRAVLRPLFTTSFLIDDWLTSVDTFGATSVIVASASSKTALALAALLSSQRDGRALEVIGLTSARNADFVREVGYYDRVVVYGDVSSLDAATPTLLVDMGGDGDVLAEVHGHFTDSLVHSCQVGATHWEQVRFGASLPGPAPALFFAPDHVQRRIAEWGGAGFDERVDASWGRFTESAATWLEIVVHRDGEAVAAAFGAVVDGGVPPRQAYIISLA